MKHLFCCVLAAGALALNAEPPTEPPTFEITTRAGAVYRNASLEAISPVGIDILFTDARGNHVLKGLKFTELTREMQEKFGYDPEAAAKFEAKIRSYAQQEMDKTAESEEARLMRVTEEVKARLSGEEITIKPADLTFAVYARRRAVVVRVLEAAKNGTLVKIMQDESGLDALPPMILLDGADLDGETDWTGFIYPTGLKARVRGNNNVPVFCASLELATDLISGYLDVYSEFAAKGNPISTGSATAAVQPDQSDQNGNTATNDQNQNQNNNNQYAGVNIGGNYFDWGYSIGGNYYPVWWWNNQRPCPPRPPRPPRPEPPKPPKPPKPEPPRPAPTPGLVVDPAKVPPRPITPRIPGGTPNYRVIKFR